MPRRAKTLTCSPTEREAVERLAVSRTDEARIVERAKMIVGCLNGELLQDIAKRLNVRPNTVIKWRQRFESEGIGGLRDRPRSGKPVTYGTDFRKKVLDLLESPPPPGQACWDGPAVAKQLNTSVHAVWRLLRKEGICLSRSAVSALARTRNLRRRRLISLGFTSTRPRTRWSYALTRSQAFRLWNAGLDMCGNMVWDLFAKGLARCEFQKHHGVA